MRDYLCYFDNSALRKQVFDVMPRELKVNSRVVTYLHCKYYEEVSIHPVTSFTCKVL